MLTDISGCLQGVANKMQYIKVYFSSSDAQKGVKKVPMGSLH